MVHLVKVLLEEEVVSHMVEHHGVSAVCGVGFAELLHPCTDALRRVVI